MKAKRQCLVWILGAAVGLGLNSQASAQQGAVILEELVVTAQKREQTLQEVPISVDVLSGDKMNEVGINQVQDLQAFVPNLTMSETGIGNNIYIRGIGSGINPGVEQSSAMFVDGVHYGRGQLYRAPLFDMQRIEVLRGPQSILFGKNSIAGAISLTTAQPTDEFEGEVSVLYEPEDEEQVFSLILSGPLGDKAAARLSVRSREIDGYLTNTFLNRSEPNRDELTVRAQLRFDATDRTSLTLKYERNQFDVLGRQVEVIDDVYDCLSLGPAAQCNFLPTPPIPYSTLLVAGFGQDPSGLNVVQDGLRSANNDFSNNESDNFTLTINHDFANDVRFTAVTGVLSYDFQELCDCDFSSAVVLDAPLFEEYDQFSQELRLTSPGGDTIDWIAGAFFQSNEQSSPDITGFPANSVLGPIVDQLVGPGAGGLFAGTGAERAFTQDTDAYNVFGQMTWNATDVFRLSLGLRYTSEEKTGFRSVTLTEFGGAPIDPVADALRFQTAAAVYANLLNVQVIGHNISGARDDTSTDYSVIGQWDVNDDWMVYGSVASGFKAGGFDTRSNVLPDPAGGVFPALRPGAFEFQDETATSYELGAKARLAGGAADLNAALFFTQYDDLQISIFDGGVGFNVGNAAGADIFGLELDGRWQLTENFGLYGSVAWLDFEFTNFLNGQCYFGEPDPDGNGLCDRTGQTNQYVADYSGAVGADYYLPVGDSLEFRTTLDILFSGEYFTAQNNDPVTVQDAYAKVNLRLALGDPEGDWEVALLARNLTDEITVPYTNPVPLASIFGSNSHYAFIERGRTFSLQAALRF
jgi:outer membrane receptor protein involved in Fe transport